MRKLAVFLLVVLTTSSCGEKKQDDHRQVLVSAAKYLTARCADSRLRGWNVKADAAGSDCRVLYVRTSVVLEDAMIEALHYGAGAYATIGRGGIDQFSSESAFRGVAYKDASGRIWTYGNVSLDEAEELEPCH
jgi:hypothetical protein